MNTPRRTVRIEDELWTAATAKANEEGTTVTEVIRNALSAYVRGAAALLVAVVAMLTVAACGGAQTPGTTPVEPTASQPVVAVTSEPVEMTVDEYVSTLERTKAHEGENTPTWSKAVEIFRENAAAWPGCLAGSACAESTPQFMAAISDDIYLPFGDLDAPAELTDLVERTRVAAQTVNAEVTIESVAALGDALNQWDQYR